MSARTITSSYVTCDVCGEQADIVAETQRAVRELARTELGWWGGHWTPGRRDVCATCWSAGKR